MNRRLDDDALADALAVGRETGFGCPDGARFWEAASGALAPAEMRSLLDHAAGCPACTLALRAAREVHGVSGLPGVAPAVSRPTLWARLSVTLLAPRPALVYLLLAAVLLPLALLPRQAPAPVPPAAVVAAPSATPAPAVSLPRVLQLTGDAALRGSTNSATLPSLGEGPVLLRLYVDPEELEPGAALRVRLLQEDAAIAELPVAARAMEAGSVDVLVDPASLSGPGPYRVEVLSGDRVVFRQSLSR